MLLMLHATRRIYWSVLVPRMEVLLKLCLVHLLHTLQFKAYSPPKMLIILKKNCLAYSL